VPALTTALQDAFAAARFPAPRVTTVTPGAGARKEALCTGTLTATA